MNIDFEGALEKSSAVAVLGIIEALKSAGMPSQKAVRLGAFALLEGALGPEVWKIVGLPRSTAYRYRKEITDASKSGLIPLKHSQEFQRAVLELITKEVDEDGV